MSIKVNFSEANDVVQFFLKQFEVQKAEYPNKIAFNFGDDGLVSLDGTTTPVTVIEGELPDTNTIASIALSDFEKLVNGETQAPTLMLKGKLKVKGNVTLLIKLRGLMRPE